MPSDYLRSTSKCAISSRPPHHFGHLRQLMLALERETRRKTKTDLGEPLRRAAQLGPQTRNGRPHLRTLSLPRKNSKNSSPASPPLDTNWSFSRCSTQTKSHSILNTPCSSTHVGRQPRLLRGSRNRPRRIPNPLPGAQRQIEAVCMKIGCHWGRLLTNTPNGPLPCAISLRDRDRRGRTVHRFAINSLRLTKSFQRSRTPKESQRDAPRIARQFIAGKAGYLLTKSQRDG